MSCERFQDSLDRFLAGELSASDETWARAHRDACSHCREVAVIFGPEGPGRDEGSDVVQRVLAQTSGSACARVETMLDDRVGGLLSGDVATLVDLHLRDCPGCQSVRATLAELSPVLAGMAELEPPAQFTRQVLEATSRRPRRARPWDRMAEQWAALLARPRFALEVSYAVTVLIVGFTATPVSPWRTLPDHLLGWLQSNAIAGSTEESAPPVWLDASIRPVRQVGSKAIDLGQRVGDGVAGDLNTRRVQAGYAFIDFGDHCRTLVGGIADGDLEQTQHALSGMGCNVKLLWRGLRKQLETEEDREC